MRIWMKYLIIGWSIVVVGLLIISFQIMKKQFIQEDYEIALPLCKPEVVDKNIEFIAGVLYYDDNEKFLSKHEFINRIKGVKSIKLESNHRVKDNVIYIALPLYTFGLWALPIFVFALVGNLFTGKAKE